MEKRITLSQINREQRKATVEEINYLFKQWVCPSMEDEFVEDLKLMEKKRLLTKAVYDFNIEKGRSRGIMMSFLGKTIGVSRQTLSSKKWIPTTRKGSTTKD